MIDRFPARKPGAGARENVYPFTFNSDKAFLFVPDGIPA
jgi:hypothetical protein